MKDKSSIASLSFGATLGFGALVFGAPIWSGILLAACGTLAAKKYIDKTS